MADQSGLGRLCGHVNARAKHVLDPTHADRVLDRRQALEGVPRLERQIHIDQPLAGVGGQMVQRDRQAALALKRAGEAAKRRSDGRMIHQTAPGPNKGLPASFEGLCAFITFAQGMR